MRAFLAALLAAVVIASTGVRAQDAPVARRAGPSGPAESFEVASVKQNNSGEPESFGTVGARFAVTGATLKEIIRVAYGAQPSRVIGGPDWINRDRFDIAAKMPERTAPPGPGRRPPWIPMLQHLLADRFNLKIHTETREMPVYALELARSDGTLGPRLERSTTDCAAVARAAAAGRRSGAPPASPTPGTLPPCRMFMGPRSAGGRDVSMTQVAGLVSLHVGRTVLDGTGLAGLWSFDLQFAPELDAQSPGVRLPPPDPNAPSLFTAMEEQLGLKLDSQRGPLDVLVIDSVDHPTEN